MPACPLGEPSQTVKRVEVPAVRIPRANCEYNNRDLIAMKQLRSIVSIITVTVLAAGAVLLVAFLSSRGGGAGEPPGTYHSPTVFAMDTTLDITIQGRGAAQAEEDSAAAVALAREIESRTSRFKPDSDVSLINAGAGATAVTVHPDTMDLVRKSLEYATMTEGAFDITIAPVAQLWGFYDQEYRVPEASEVEAALSLVDYTKVVMNDVGGTVMLTDAGMSIDLGGVAKGYAVERMCDLLRERGVKSALVNFGGAVGAIGRRVDGRKWVIGIRHPRDDGGALVGELEVEDAFVSSSGDYERYFIRDGTRYCHLLDPATGRQPGGVISATVIGPDSTAADVVSTALFVYGTDRGMEFMAGLPRFEALVIDREGEVVYTRNMEAQYVTTMPERI